MKRLGIFSYFGFELPLEERLRLIAAAGFQATSLWLGTEEASVAAGKANDMPQMVRDVGLVLDNAHASYADCQLLWSDCEEESNRVLSDYERALEFCHEHGIPTLVAHITAGQFPASFTAPGLKNIEWLMQRAETLGVILAIENTRKPDKTLTSCFRILGLPTSLSVTTRAMIFSIVRHLATFFQNGGTDLRQPISQIRRELGMTTFCQRMEQLTGKSC